MPQLTLKLVDDSIQIGDRVYCTMYGFGVVIDYRNNSTYPIKIRFNNAFIINIVGYTTSGKYAGFLESTLYRIPNSTSSKDIQVNVTLNIE